ncbi:ATP-dependent RNA helicase [Trichoderma ghanense]|uniref:RBR-type E3 ubiquitin transferase n=1 Tax=Trichoderma ghanense TaxID=65468 RepID=A0ABY2H6Q5_9HYPO
MFTICRYPTKPNGSIQLELQVQWQYAGRLYSVSDSPNTHKYEVTQYARCRQHLLRFMVPNLAKCLPGTNKGKPEPRHPTRSNLALDAGDWRAATPCRFFQMGSCTRGPSCPFSHSNVISIRSAPDPQTRGVQLGKARTADPSTATAPPESAKPACRFFKAGKKNCVYGEKCLFLHAGEDLASPDAAPAALAVADAIEDEPKKDDFSRTIGGAFVQFEAGARVSKIRLPSDFSAVRINGLPQGTSEQSVRDMLAQKGFGIKVDDVYMLHMDGSCGASVRSDDPSFSKRLCALFHSGYTWEGVKIYATPIAAPMPSGHSARRVDCKKVHISWHKAVRNAWLNFGNGDTAKRVSELFSKGTYRILDQKVATGPATEAQPAFHSYARSPSRDRVNWTVMLTEVPAAAERKDILQAIPLERNRPRHVEIGPPTYSTDAEQASAMIRSLLTNIGALEYFEVTLETNARRVKATARFLDESDARRAATELDKKELPFHRKARLTVQMVYSAKFKAGTNIYDAVYPRILAQQTTWKGKNVFFKAYNSADPLKRFRLLKIEGESADAVAAAKADLESILAGVVAKRNGITLWDSSLKGNGQLFQAIKKLETELSVTILRDRGRSELRLFGSQPRCEEAERRLVELIRVESLSTSIRVIELEPHKFFWACHGGFRKIAARIGTENASFDIISTPKKIVISGSLEDYDVALAIMEGQEQVAEPVVLPGPDEAAQECSVCWTEAEAPVKTSCGHVYCQECFERSCTVGDGTAADFAILCHGNQGSCKDVIVVEDLQEHLSSSALEDVLERSFSSYIKRNPNEFRYCPTPDCGYIYRVSSEARTQNCSNCLRPTCSACHEPHVGMSCAEHRDIKTGGYQAFTKLKKELGIKDCPKCKTPLEKISGCNHMTCIACDAHICWVCLMTFPKGESVYEHMRKLHGGHIDVPGL